MVFQPSSLEIIHTKLHRPVVTHALVARKYLLDRLNKRLNRPLSLVCAPAGYGKSTLVSSWLETRDLPVAWLSLSEADNDLQLFLSYFIEAIKLVSPEFGRKIQTTLKGHELPSTKILASLLINELDKIDTSFVLTLDDYHVIQNTDIHELFEEILEYPPQAMHLVLVSRIDPPLPLVTLRAKGQMTEVRVRDLRFSRAETAEFLQQMLKRPIEERILSIFEEKTEGWVTGMRLAALALRKKKDLGRVATDLQDTNRYVLDYFVEEILSQQPAAMQDYLLATSVLDRFCAPLCDAIFISGTLSVCDEIDGKKFLQLLIKTNLFVIRLDDNGRWFRYHHLFKNLLNRRIKHRFKQEDIGVIHTNASTWLAENGHFEEAVEHALTGGEIEKAVEIVGRARHDLMSTDQWHRIERWLKMFPHEAVQQYPHLLLLRCLLNLWHWYRLDHLVKDLDQVELMLESSAFNTREGSSLKAEVAVMRSVLTYWTLKPSNGVALIEQALLDIPAGHEFTHSTAVFCWVPLCQMLGEIKRGERLIWDHMEDGRYKKTSSQARFLQSLCIAYWPESETRKLQQAASGLLRISLENDLSWNYSFARYFLGLIHYERNELSDAVAQFEIIVGDPQLYPIQNVTHCSFLLSLSYQALGLTDNARTVAESIAKLTFERGNKMFIDLAEAFQAELDLIQGRIAQADQWCSTFVAPHPHGMQRFFNAEFTSIRVLMAQKTPQSLKFAATQLDSMQALLEQIHHRRLLIDVFGMQALLADTLNQESNAFEQLSKALTLAEPGGFLRPFLDLGYQMAALLECFAKQKTDLKYIEQLLAAFSNEKSGMKQDVSVAQKVRRSSLSNQALLDPLTKREFEILLILTQRLSNSEIARRLFISSETVKKHLYNIYQKLGVKNRQQAIAKAKSLGIV